MSRSYDPHADLADDAPDRLSPTPTGRERAVLQGADQDADWLLDQPQFRRWLLTFTEKARMYSRTHWTQDTSLAAEAGRRDLGLEVLDDLRRIRPDVDVIVAVEKSRTPGVRT